MFAGLRSVISKGWPVRAQETKEVVCIRPDDIYTQHSSDQNPQKLFEKASSWLTIIQEKRMDQVQTDLVLKETQDAVIRAIFGSNMIERAGLGWEITLNLCRSVFAGEHAGDVLERTSKYENQLLDLQYQEGDDESIASQNFHRGRLEIVQHARAYQHIIHHVVVKQDDLTEDLIKETHRILTRGVPIVEKGFPDVPPEKYGGIYRKVPVGAGSTMFTVPQHVPGKMREMCDKLKADIEEAEKQKSIDPFSIASKYSLEFVQIHPFQDGNGRMCRMILNAILARYAGIIVPIGEKEDEITEYINIKKRASENMEGHGEYATFILKRAVPRLRELKKKLTGKGKSA
ncbi:fic/DOC family protein [Colletotrichum tabaci]|uniref:Fic/DOC family protein n=1 Tax=Colletotrichum tabaci TaxID=1209068 RepID=A0AAV9TIB5_9PEZI